MGLKKRLKKRQKSKVQQSSKSRALEREPFVFGTEHGIVGAMKLFQVETYDLSLFIFDSWDYQRCWIGSNQSQEDVEFMNWMVDTIYAVIDGPGYEWEREDMYPYDYQY